MPGPVVFAFAVDDSLVPVAGAAPYDVLARQLPRLLVARLNGSADRGARFFPFLGPIDGKRCFLRLAQLFDPAMLAQVHKQGDVPLLCDGMLRPGVLRWRLIDGRSGAVRREVDTPFDPCQPLDVLPRLEFELADQLGWEGRPQPVHALRGPALGWFLVLKDDLLRREANLPVEADVDALRAARECVVLAPGEREVHDTVFDLIAHLLRAREHRAECARLLATLASAIGDDVARLERLDALLLAAGDAATAAAVAYRAALLQPQRAELVERAAAQAFKLARYEDVRAVVGVARARGCASAAALAQLAAVCDRSGDHEGRAELVRELVGVDDLPVPVARLVVSFLLEEDHAALARGIVERALKKEPDHAMLHFEHGRALLLLDDGNGAAAALLRALQLGVGDAVARQARRLLRFAAVPGLWAGMQAVERAFGAGDLDAAYAAARALVRKVRRVAEAWFLLGLVLHKRGRLQRAERVLRVALQLDDACPETHNRLGILLVASGRAEDGVRHLQRAHALAPSDPGPLLHLAQACALLGRADEAATHVAAAERAGAEPELLEAVRREILAKPA
jgi:tetratricopeptide (TPR) repeat protein